MKFFKIFLIAFVLFNCAILPAFGAALTLRDSIGIAEQNNPAMISAKENVLASEGIEGQAFSPLLPQLKLEGSIGRSYQQPISISSSDFEPPPPFTFSGTILPDEAAMLTSYQATLSQSLFTGWKVSSGLDIAKKNLEISRENLRSISQDLVYNVTKAYYGMLKAKKYVDLSEEALDMAKSHLGQVKAMFSAGTVTRSDVLRSEVQVANAEINLTKAKSAMEIAKNSFNSVLGRDLNEKVEIVDEEFVIEEFTAPRYEEFLSEAYKERPEWKQFLLAKKIRESGVTLARGGYFPDIALVGTYGGVKNEYSNAGRTDDLTSWSALIAGSWDLFDGLSTPSKVKEAEARLNAQKAEEQNIRNALALEVKDACFNLNTATETVKMTKKALELAEENHRIAELSYNSGVATNIEVLDAQAALTQAKLAYLEAQFDYEIAKANINKVVGKEVFKKEGIGIPEERIITVVGFIQYIPIEGGFIGLIDDAGNKYDLMGEKALEISKSIGEGDRRKAKVTGRPKKDIITVHMWGTPFEVIEYEWKQ